MSVTNQFTMNTAQCSGPFMPPPSKAFPVKSNIQSKAINADANRKTVSFEINTAVFVVENWKYASQKEKDKRWLKGDDVATFKRECRKIVDELKRSANASIFAYRGLEMVDPEAVVRRRRHQTDVTSAVLIEQREQRSKAVTNPKAIRKAYRAHVVECMKEALENAYIDEKAVKHYLSTTNIELEEEYLKAKREHCSPDLMRNVLRPKLTEGSIVTRLSFRRSFSTATIQSVGSATDD
jgi:hypothetical protein